MQFLLSNKGLSINNVIQGEEGGVNQKLTFTNREEGRSQGKSNQFQGGVGHLRCEMKYDVLDLIVFHVK